MAELRISPRGRAEAYAIRKKGIAPPGFNNSSTPSNKNFTPAVDREGDAETWKFVFFFSIFLSSIVLVSFLSHRTQLRPWSFPMQHGRLQTSNTHAKYEERRTCVSGVVVYPLGDAHAAQ